MAEYRITYWRDIPSMVTARDDAGGTAKVQLPDRFQELWSAGMRAKLGLSEGGELIDVLISDLLSALHENRLDYTSSFRGLAGCLRGARCYDTRGRHRCGRSARFTGWRSGRCSRDRSSWSS